MIPSAHGPPRRAHPFAALGFVLNPAGRNFVLSGFRDKVEPDLLPLSPPIVDFAPLVLLPYLVLWRRGLLLDGPFGLFPRTLVRFGRRTENKGSTGVWLLLWPRELLTNAFRTALPFWGQITWD